MVVPRERRSNSVKLTRSLVRIDLPRGIWLTVAANQAGTAMYVADARLGLIGVRDAVVLHRNPTIVADSKRVDRQFFQVARGYQVIERLRRLLLIQRVLIDHL